MAGLVFFFGIVAAFSSNLRAVNWWTIGWGIVLQLTLAILVLNNGRPYQIVAGICMAAIVVAVGSRALHAGYCAANRFAGRVIARCSSQLRWRFTSFSSREYDLPSKKRAMLSKPSSRSPTRARSLSSATSRTRNIWLRSSAPTILFSFAFKALPPILFVSAFFTVLYHFGILQWCVRMLAVVMVHLMGTSGAETLSVAANVFMGQTEAPLIVRPYVPRMTNSELFALMASGMAHISGALMVVYISYGADPVAVLTTCVMACPCSLYLAKLFLPEVSKPVTGGTVHTHDEKSPYVNAIDAAATGTSDGLSLALNVAAMLIVFIAFVAMFDALLGQIKPGSWRWGFPRIRSPTGRTIFRWESCSAGCSRRSPS